VRRVSPPQETAPPDLYFQRRLAGRSVSLTLLADGREARVLGYCEQWCASRPGPRPYTYGGAVTLSPQALPRGLAGALTEAVEALARALGLRGLCTLDTIISGGQWWALELNPRPGATLELHERGASLLGLHIEAVRGHLPRRPPPLGAGARAHAIVYAPRRLKVPPRWRWPGWVSDLPRPGTSLAPGDPVCTVHARGPDSAAARRQAWRKRQTVMGWTDTWLKN
jgi:predicted ATP-grasp superfamily ATP-dependent carboligase